MCLKKVLRIAIVVEWATIILFIMVSKMLESSLPSQLQNYLLWETEQELTTIEFLFLIPMIIFILMYLISSIGLFLYKPWAKRLYIIIRAFGFFLLLFSGPYVDHGIAYAIGELESVTFGFILALLLFTNVYEDKKEQYLE